MSPRRRPPNPARACPRRAAILLLLATLAAATLACGARFDPTGPCTTDGQAPGSYPDLEGLVPKAFRATAPDRLDSGRHCSAKALGSLASHGVGELRFAGATWALGADSGVTLAILEAAGIEADWVAEFYEAGARAAPKTTSIETRTIQLPDSSPAFRLDTLNGESYQTVVVWPDDPRVRVAVVASHIRATPTKAAHDALVADALAAYFTRSASQGPRHAPAAAET